MTTIVYPYLHQLSQWDELKYSIRSVCKNFKEPFEIVIIGDKPTWYNGKHIQTTPIRGRKFTRAFDIARKLEIICKSEMITENFVYMYDDQYFINSTELKDFDGAVCMNEIVKRKVPKLGSETWLELMARTVEVLHQNGHEKIYNYETHLPRVLSKKKLRIMMDAYDLHRNPLLFNTIYFNEFYPVPRIILEQSNPIKAGVYKPMTSDGIRHLCRDKKILNNGERGFNHSLKIFLKNSFPEKCRFEL